MYYIQITNRCLFHCAHCCFSCGPVGNDMTWSTFRRAIEMAKEYDSHVTIGGGEPTLHAQFWRFMGYAIGQLADSDGGIFIVTNGNQTHDALALARMAKKGIIGAAVSKTRYHQEISQDVVMAFTKPDRRSEGSYYNDGRSQDLREIRGDDRVRYFVPFKVGRAKDLESAQEGCACDAWFVEPSGLIRFCGCPGSPVVGDVHGGILSQWVREKDDGVECSRQLKPVEIYLPLGKKAVTHG